MENSMENFPLVASQLYSFSQTCKPYRQSFVCVCWEGWMGVLYLREGDGGLIKAVN